MDRRSQLTAQLHALNDRFAGWVRQQSEGNRDQLWAVGAQEYCRHAQKLLVDFKDVLEPAQAAPSGPAPWTGSFGGFGNGGQGSGLSSAAAPSAFGIGGFGSPAAGLASSSAAGNGNAAEPADDEAAEPAEKIRVDKHTQILFESTATLYVQTPAEETPWSNRGRGLVTLRKPQTEGASQRPCHLVFTTDTGRVLVNASLYAGLKPVEKPKGRVLLSLPQSEEREGEVKTEMRVYLLQLPQDKVAAAVEAITKNLPSKDR